MALAQFAPSLLKLFGAGEPTISVANKVVGIAQAVTGATTPEEALASMKASQEAQAAFALATLNQETDLQKAFLLDIQDARARDNTFRAAGQKNIRGDILAYLAVGGFLMSLAVILFVPMEQGLNRDLIFTMLGALIMLVKDVYGFEFGTTRQSKDKDATISNLTKGN